MSEQPIGERAAGSVGERPDPLLRPPDPAGTQPKVDPRSLDLGQGQDQGHGPSRATFLPAPVALPPGAPSVELEPAPPPPPAHPHSPRFQFLFGALGALGVCAIGLCVLLLSAPKAAAPKPWSAWRPLNDGVDPAQQIAEHVAPSYRLDNGRQIVRVSGGPPELNGKPMTVGTMSSGRQPARLEGNSVLYRMCGGGSNCSIKEGKPSCQRGLLLSREALELSLYTFRYVGGVDQVIVTIPPPPSGAAKASGTATCPPPTKAYHALMFRSQDVAEELSRPLASTLTAGTPRVSQVERSPDALLVRQLTGSRFYDYTIIDEASQSVPVMLLAPPT